MAVLLAETVLAVRRAQKTRDPHGRPVTGWAAATTAYPARVHEQGDGVWDLYADPQLWPVQPGDVLQEPSGRGWLVLEARKASNVVLDTLDYLICTGRIRKDGGTVPHSDGPANRT